MCSVAGDLVYTYLSLGYRNPVTDVSFHPFENMVAFCSYGESHLIKIYTYDYNGYFQELIICVTNYNTLTSQMTDRQRGMTTADR